MPHLPLLNGLMSRLWHLIQTLLLVSHFLTGQIIAGFLDRYGKFCSGHDMWFLKMTTALIWKICWSSVHSLTDEHIVGFLDRYGQPCSDYLSESSMTMTLIFGGSAHSLTDQTLSAFLIDSVSYTQIITHLEDVRFFHQRKQRSFLYRHRGCPALNVSFLDAENTAFVVDAVGCARITYQNQ